VRAAVEPERVLALRQPVVDEAGRHLRPEHPLQHLFVLALAVVVRGADLDLGAEEPRVGADDQRAHAVTEVEHDRLRPDLLVVVMMVVIVVVHQAHRRGGGTAHRRPAILSAQTFGVS